MIINGDILVQKIKVKKAIFKFPTPLFHQLFGSVHITYIPKEPFLWLSNDM